MPRPEPAPPHLPTWLTRRGSWRVLAALTALALLAPAALWGWSRLHPTTRTTTEHLRHPLSAVRIDAEGGSVLVRPGPAGETTLRTTRTWTDAAPRVEHSWQGDTLHIRLSKPPHGWFDGLPPAAVVELRIPPATPVTARLTSGLADLRGLRGPLDLAGTTATLRVNDSAGPLTATTTHGAIRGSGLSSPTLTTSVGAGSASLRFIRAPGTITATLATGAVQLRVPEGSRYRTAIRSDHADVRTPEDLPDPSSRHLLTVTAGRTSAASIGY